MKQDQFNAAVCALQASFALRDSWSTAERMACERFGKGPLTSGLGNASLADDATKDHLRQLLHAAQDAESESLRIWRRARGHSATWRRFRNVLLDDWRAKRDHHCHEVRP